MLELHAAVPSSVRPRSLQVHARWLGEDKVVALRDDGLGGPADQPADGVYVGLLEGPRPQLLPLRLVADGGPPLWEGTVRPAADHELVGFLVQTEPGGLHAVTLPVAPRGRTADTRELAWTAAGFGWAALILIYVLGLSLRRSP